MKKYGSQVGEPDQKLQLKIAVLYGERVGEIHMPQPVRFVAAKKEVGWARLRTTSGLISWRACRQL